VRSDSSRHEEERRKNDSEGGRKKKYNQRDKFSRERQVALGLLRHIQNYSRISHQEDGKWSLYALLSTMMEG
jgi:hypothetical protein